MNVLGAYDMVGISFFITSMALLAATVFFYLERPNVPRRWQLSMSIMILVCLIATIHYFYMRDFWIQTGQSPTSYRYIDWFITVPLQIIEFYLILNTVSPQSLWMFWRLLSASVIMLVCGYIGETSLQSFNHQAALGAKNMYSVQTQKNMTNTQQSTNEKPELAAVELATAALDQEYDRNNNYADKIIDSRSGYTVGDSVVETYITFWLLGMVAWLYILYEIFFGGAAAHYRASTDKSLRYAFYGMRLIVTVGWAIYPIGYMYGVDFYSVNLQQDFNMLNILYNYADFVNKIAFGVVIWYAARMSKPELDDGYSSQY